MFGFGLVILGCRLIMRFAHTYFEEHRSAYTTAEQSLLDNLFTAAAAIEAALTPPLEP